MPWDKEFKSDIKENHGKLNYIDNEGNDITKVIETPKGDYSEIYNAMYDAIINNKELPVKEEEVLEVMNILNNGIKECYKI